MLYKTRKLLAIIIFVFAILGFLGIFYPLNIFDVQVTPLVQRIITDFSITAVILLSVITIITLIFGRIYCSLICPLGIFQELISFFKNDSNEKQPNLPIKYFISAITFGILLGGSAIAIRYIDPYTLFESALTLSVIGIIAVITIILIVVFRNRFFCTNICPVGTILGLLSKLSLFKIHIDKNECLSCGMCERNCPSGCIDLDEENVENETCIKCFKCVDKCPKNAIKYGIKPKTETKFSLKRRELLISSAALVVLLGALKAGVEISKNTAKKIKNIILPPGSLNENRLFNKCLNCNLCVEACPNKIIQKADKEFGAIHIDYENNGFCKFDCNECSKVCPSGAIKKLTLEEKQKTRIGIAVLNQKECTNCGSCVFECPVQAITKEVNKPPVIDSSKCIGCGACKRVCSVNAIEIFAVNEQKII